MARNQMPARLPHNQLLRQSGLYALATLTKITSTLTPQLLTRLLLCVAGMSVLLARASDVESSLAETEGEVRTWRNPKDLPADSVTAIVQARDGLLWVGTSAGLVRFDGVKFTPVELARLPANNPIWVTSLCEDGRGHLWVGTQQDGLFELAEGQVSQYTTRHGLLDNNVTSLATDNEGLVWIGTKSGLNLNAGRDFRSFTMREGLPDDFVIGVHVARSKTVWITTRSGMCQFINGRIATYALKTESQGRQTGQVQSNSRWRTQCPSQTSGGPAPQLA